jgi:hypothetical protein
MQALTLGSGKVVKVIQHLRLFQKIYIYKRKLAYIFPLPSATVRQVGMGRDLALVIGQ